MDIIPGLVSMLCWGVAIFLAAIVSRKIGNVLTLFWMQIFGFLAGCVYFALNLSTYTFQTIPKFLPILIIISVLQMIAYLSFYKGTEKGQVTLVSPLGASWGLITAIAGIAFYGEDVQVFKIIAIFLIICGIVLLSINIKQILYSKKIELLGGIKEGFLAMLGWGISLSLLVIPTKELDWFLPSFIFRFLLILLLFSYMLIKRKPFFAKTGGKFPVLELIIIGIFDMGAFMALSLGLSRFNSSLISPIASSYAIITIFLAMIFLKEKIELSQLIGIIMVILGIISISI